MKVTHTFVQLCFYFVIGLLATLVEWLAFYVMNYKFSFHYALATALAFCFSTFANWFFGRLILFQKKSSQSTVLELIKIYIVSIIGLVFNIIIMYFTIEKLGMSDMIAKITATGIVFIWNFLVRKFLIYKI